MLARLFKDLTEVNDPSTPHLSLIPMWWRCHENASIWLDWHLPLLILNHIALSWYTQLNRNKPFLNIVWDPINNVSLMQTAQRYSWQTVKFSNPPNNLPSFLNIWIARSDLCPRLCSCMWPFSHRAFLYPESCLP